MITFLDTSAIIEFVKDTDKGKNVEQYLDENAAVSPIVLYEVFVGLTPKQIIKFDEILEKLIVIPYDFECYLQTTELRNKMRKKGIGCDDWDLLIAATVLAHDARLITCDTDFLRLNLKNCVLV